MLFYEVDCKATVRPMQPAMYSFTPAVDLCAVDAVDLCAASCSSLRYHYLSC